MEGIKKNKKILFLGNHFVTLYSYRKELIEKLLTLGNEVYVSIPKDENSYFEKLGAKVIITEVNRHGTNLFQDLKLIFIYRKIFRKVKPDIIFSYTIKPNIYGTLASNGKYKQVCNITGMGGIFTQENFLSKICRLLYRFSVKRSYKVFFQNTGDRDYFINHSLIKDNYEVIAGSGCNLDEHPYSFMPNDELVRFIFIGRVMKLKGIEEYLQAAQRIKAEYSITEFFVAGWNEEEKYKKILSEYHTEGVITYLGFREDISKWIGQCHCTVLPSHAGEGIPNVLLESAASGRCCIGSDIPGTRDVIEDNKTGYLFEPKNVDDLVSKMRMFIEIPYEEKVKMGARGRLKVEKDYNRENIIQKYLDEVG